MRYYSLHTVISAGDFLEDWVYKWETLIKKKRDFNKNVNRGHFDTDWHLAILDWSLFQTLLMMKI